MKTKFFLVAALIALSSLPSKAQFVVTDPTNLAQSIVNTTRNVVETSTTASNMIKNFEQTVKIYKQGQEYYDALKSVHNLVKDAKKVQNTILLVGDISDIYVSNFQKMLSDSHYTVSELSAIASGYAKLLEQASDMLLELKDVVNVNGLSMTDSERMGIVSDVYERLKKHRNLVMYYTRKNISVSYLRAQKTGDTDRVMSLYGTATDKYW